MSDRSGLLIASALFFAALAKDIAVPAFVLSALACLRWVGLKGIGRMAMKGQVQ